MKKRCGFLALLTVAKLMTACGSKDSAKEDKTDKTEQTQERDLKSIGEAIVSKVSFQKELTLVDQEVIKNYITLEEGVSALMWMSDGSTAEEVIVFEVPNEEVGNVQMENAQMYLSDQKSSFEDYIPEEAKRIDDAVMMRDADKIIVCVSEDSTQAAQMIEKILN